MKVFITWGGSLSHAVAEAVHEWLPSVIQTVKPFLSSEDIRKGQRWGAEVASQLDSTAFGLVCLTRDNLNTGWLNFEAGAIVRSPSGHLATLLVDLSVSDVTGPLSQFQSTPIDSEDEMLKLVVDINTAAGTPVEVGALRKQFARVWPELELRVAAAISKAGDKPRNVVSPLTKTEQMLEELLKLTRDLQRNSAGGQISKRSRRRIKVRSSAPFAVINEILSQFDRATDGLFTAEEQADFLTLTWDGGPTVSDGWRLIRLARAKFGGGAYVLPLPSDTEASKMTNPDGVDD